MAIGLISYSLFRSAAACNLEAQSMTAMESEADKPLLRLETMIGFGGNVNKRFFVIHWDTIFGNGSVSNFKGDTTALHMLTLISFAN